MAGAAVVLCACGVQSAEESEVALARAAWRGGEELSLRKTLTPRSFQVIDCEGGRIASQVSALDDGIGSPQTLIFLDHVWFVRIRNCDLEGSFPIVALGGGFHTIANNSITATGMGALFFDSSHNLVVGNEIATSGRGVLNTGDSDHNVIADNAISFLNGPSAEGDPGLSTSGPPNGLGIGNFVYPGATMLKVNNKLHQVLSYGDTQVDGTLILANTFDMTGGFAAVVAATRSADVFAGWNTAEGGELGFNVFGYPEFVPFWEPGTCSRNPQIRCGGGPVGDSNPDDWCTPFNAGTCEDLVVIPGDNNRADNPMFVGNDTHGVAVGSSIHMAGGYVLESNDFSDTCVGINLTEYALERGTVRGNTVTSTRVCDLWIAAEGGPGVQSNVGLSTGVVTFGDMPVNSGVGVEIAYNDFGNTDRPFDAWLWDEEVFVDLPFEDAIDLHDNWWGSEGFPSDPWWQNVDDPSARAAPVAGAWRVGDEHLVPQL